MHKPISIVLTKLPARPELASCWRDLETRANTSFFTTWSWLGAWLNILPADMDVRLLKALCGDQVVGLGLVVQGKSRLMRLIPVSSWHVHATGIPQLDDLTIEYNGFLVDQSMAEQVADAMVNHLLYQTKAGRISINRAANSYAALAQKLGKRAIARSTQRESHMVCLDTVRAAHGDYASLLSANTRSQLKRSLNAYKKLGPVALHEAQSVEQAMAYLAALKVLHDQTWQERGVQSGFGSDAATQTFHKQLIESSFERGEVQMLRITVGDTDLGYLYNFRHRGRVAFYQSGLHYGLLDKNDRPGVVCHALAIEHNAAQNASLYDFLAGDHRYKSSLSTHTEAQATHLFQRNGLLPRLDASLRKWRGKLRTAWAQSKENAARLSMVLALYWASPYVEDLQCLI